MLRVFPEARFSSLCIMTAVQSLSGDRSFGKPLMIMVIRFSSCRTALSIGFKALMETRHRSRSAKTAKSFERSLSVHSAKAGCLSL